MTEIWEGQKTRKQIHTGQIHAGVYRLAPTSKNLWQYSLIATMPVPMFAHVFTRVNSDSVAESKAVNKH